MMVVVVVAYVCVLLLLHLSVSIQQQQDCSTLFTFNASVLNFTKCANLPSQDAVLAWTFYEGNRSLAIAFAGRAPSSSGWVGWGLNPSAPRMVGSSVLVAFSAQNGSNILPYKLTAAVQLSGAPLACSPVDLVIEATAVEIEGASMSFFASLRLSSNQTTLHHVWNNGPGVNSFEPLEHSLVGDGLSGFQTIDVYTAQAVAGSSEPPLYALKRTHGVVNTVAWGIMLPLGVMFARYLRAFPIMEPAWFYLHASCQTLGYCLGLLGWSLGMRLHSLSTAVHRCHLNIGIVLFVMATLQVLALGYRPDKDAGKVRKFWNVYHYSLGYAILLLGIINVFQGLNILEDQNILKQREGWRAGYVAALSIMGVTALVLELVALARYLCKRKLKLAAEGNFVVQGQTSSRS